MNSLEAPCPPWRALRSDCSCDRTAAAPEPELLAGRGRVLGQVLHRRLIPGGPAWEQGQTWQPRTTGDLPKESSSSTSVLGRERRFVPQKGGGTMDNFLPRTDVMD